MIQTAFDRAARHGTLALILAEGARDIRAAAVVMCCLRDPASRRTVAELRRLAENLDARRRRVMAGPREVDIQPELPF
jgi:hypothetical protein